MFNRNGSERIKNLISSLRQFAVEINETLVYAKTATHHQSLSAAVKKFNVNADALDQILLKAEKEVVVNVDEKSKAMKALRAGIESLKNSKPDVGGVNLEEHIKAVKLLEEAVSNIKEFVEAIALALEVKMEEINMADQKIRRRNRIVALGVAIVAVSLGYVFFADNIHSLWGSEPEQPKPTVTSSVAPESTVTSNVAQNDMPESEEGSPDSDLNTAAIQEIEEQCVVSYGSKILGATIEEDCSIALKGMLPYLGTQVNQQGETETCLEPLYEEAGVSHLLNTLDKDEKIPDCSEVSEVAKAAKDVENYVSVGSFSQVKEMTDVRNNLVRKMGASSIRNTETLDEVVKEYCHNSELGLEYCPVVRNNGLVSDLKDQEHRWLGKNGKVNTEVFEKSAANVVNSFVKDNPRDRRHFSEDNKANMVVVLMGLYPLYRNFWFNYGLEMARLECIHKLIGYKVRTEKNDDGTYKYLIDQSRVKAEIEIGDPGHQTKRACLRRVEQNPALFPDVVLTKK